MFSFSTIRALLFVAVAAALHNGALAQGTGTVASPVIKPGASISMASGIAFDDGDEGFAYRIDYRRTVAENFRVATIVFFNDRRGDFRYRRLELETMHQFASSKRGWSSAIQLRGRIPDGNDGPGRIRAAWLNRWRPGDNVELRLIGLASREFGDSRKNGFALETRSEVTWRVSQKTRFGAQMFNRYNTTANFGSFDSQRHSVGAVAKGALTKKISYRVNALAGLTEAASDFELRARLRLSI